MFSVLKNVFHKISATKLKKDERKDTWWIKLILELFSEIHQIDHDINKIFCWLLSECKSLYDDIKSEETYIDTNKLEIYLNALLATLHIAIDRKQGQLKGLEILLKDICLNIITSQKLNNNNNLNKIAMTIIEYLCHHTDNVWSLCSEFTIFQLNKHCTVSDASHHQIIEFEQLSQFILMLLKDKQANNIVEWISNIHSLCCKLIWNNPYLKILCKTLFFHIYANHTEPPCIHQTLLHSFSKELLLSINQQKSKLSMQHFLLIQWIADIIFTDELQLQEEEQDIAKQYRNCILYGLKSNIKAMEQISIQLLGNQKYHRYILSPMQLSNECIDSICILYNIMYEVRASTVNNILTFKLTKLVQLLSVNDKKADGIFDATRWIQSILHIIWEKGLKHRNKAVRRITMYALLSWDFEHKRAPFDQSFILNEFLSLLNHPLWFRRSYYDITKNKGNEKYSARPQSNWQNVNSKSEEALSTKSPPEGFGFLIESFLAHYVFKCIEDPFAKQVFLSEFIVSVSTKVTSFYSLYHIFGFLANIHKHHDDDDQPLSIINSQNLTSFQIMLKNLLPKFGPLYNKKLAPLICQFISLYMDTNIGFYSVCKLLDAIPKQYVSPIINNEGFVYLCNNLNKEDWIGIQLFILIQEYMTKPNTRNIMKIDVIKNMIQYVKCTESYQNIINMLFEVVSVSYSQPYKSEHTVTFCMQLLSVVIHLSENYTEWFAKHRDILRQRMGQSIDEIVSYIFDQELVKVDFSQHQNWILNLSQNLIQYYGNSSSVESWMSIKLKAILPTIYLHSTQKYYVIQDFPSLFLCSICIKYHYKFTNQILQSIQSGNDNELDDSLLSLWISIRVNPNLHKTHCNTLQHIQFNAILGILSEQDTIISKNIARNVIQFAVHSLDTAQGQMRAPILECISLLLPFAKLSTSNLNVLSTSAWHVLQDTNINTSIPDSYCVDLLLFPALFNDKNLHCEPDGHIRNQLLKAIKSKKSTILQPIMRYVFLLWFKHPDIAILYVDNIVAMTHTMYNIKIYDPEDRINREEYLFAALLMFLSVMFQQTTKQYQEFKSLFLSKLFEMINKECELPYLDTIHQKTWNIFWHISQFITNQYGFEDTEINNILEFLCDLCYNMDRAISSNQRQWITLSIIRIIVEAPKRINHLYKKYEIIGRRPNTHVWLMYALGDTTNKLVFKYESQPNSISKEFLMDTLQRVISIITPYLSNNYGLVRTTSQYFFYALMQHYIAIDPHHNLGAAVMAIYKDLKETPDSIKLRKRLKTCYQWLEQCDEVESECNYKEHDLKISREKAYKETQILQSNITKTILAQHPILNENKQMVDEIVYLIKNRIGLVSFTDQLADALSSVLLSTFEYYSGSKPKQNNNDDYKELMGYQRKLDPLMMGYNKCVETEQLRLEQDIKANRRKCFGDVIVVASLLEKPTNIGGISRTCEIFGVKEMIVHDKRLLKRDDFKRLSVTSEQWLPIEEISRKNLITYLREQKAANDYFIIGLEQTTNSVALNEIEFIGAQAKCIIIIGTEKTGLPPDIINECDICVEIPQFGVVRSLNAHVSFAITLWEYIKQQLKQSDK